MQQNDPLINTNHFIAPKVENSNRRGRPSRAEVIRFCPQPKSIVALKLCEERKNLPLKTFEVKVDDYSIPKLPNYLVETKVCSPLSTVSNDDCLDHIEDTEPEPEFKEEKKTTTKKRTTKKRENKKKLKLTLEEIKATHTITCPYCSYSCQRIEQLRAHSKVHKRVLKYDCDYEGCKYTSKISSNVTKHKRIHTKEQPYLCELCSFKTSFISSLKVHKRIHTKEKPFCCERCGYRCNSSSNLKKHWRHRHPMFPYVPIKKNEVKNV